MQRDPEEFFKTGLTKKTVFKYMNDYFLLLREINDKLLRLIVIAGLGVLIVIILLLSLTVF